MHSCWINFKIHPGTHGLSEKYFVAFLCIQYFDNFFVELNLLRTTDNLYFYI